MRTYENAYVGVKRIRAGVILKLLATIFAAVGTILTGVATGMQLMEGEFNIQTVLGLAAAAAGIMLVTLVISIIAFILQLMGLSRASVDNDRFRTAAVWVVISLIIAVIVNIIPQFIPDAFITAANALNSVMDLIVISLVVSGCSQLLPELAGRARFIQIVICIPVIISAVLQIVAVNPSFAAVCGIISIIASIVYFFAYLSFLGKVKKALE